MKTSTVVTPVLIPLLALLGCAADLVVSDVELNWDAAEKKAVAEIANVGNKDAGEFFVYFNGDELPLSQNRRPQVSHSVPGLGLGESIILESDFWPLAHPDNSNLANVYQISIVADAKGMVDESNEDNNSKHAPTATMDVELYDKNGDLVPADPQTLAQVRQPVLFIHGHNLVSAVDEDLNYQKNWQKPLDYFSVLKLPSFKIALDLPQNHNLNIEPYYIRFEDQNRSILEDAFEIQEAVERILKRHNDSEARQVKIAIIAYSKGTISTRVYLKYLMPVSQTVSEFIAIAPPNHGLSAGSSFTTSSLAFRQLNNGYDDECNSFGENQSEDFIESLNGHPIEDTQTSSAQGPQYDGEAPGSRSSAEPVDQGILYVSLYAKHERDSVGGHIPSEDCQGRLLAKNLASDAENIEVPYIAGVGPILTHANTVHTPAVICLALYTAAYHQAPIDVSCLTTEVEDRDVPIIPSL